LAWFPPAPATGPQSRPPTRPPPPRQRPHHETELTSALGERVRSARRALRVERARHQSLTLHSPQAVGEQLRRDADELGPEGLKSRGAPQQVPNDEQRPALANQIERLRNGAVLTVPLRHADEYSRPITTARVSSKSDLDSASHPL